MPSFFMPSFSKFDKRRGGKNLAEKPITFRRRVWTVTGVLLLAVGLQLHAQQADLDAAAAKAAADQEALTHAPANIPRPIGTFITFDVPGAGTENNQGTVPTSINPAGAITGYYVEANNSTHGFLRARNGTFITFDVPGAVNGTQPNSINPAGAITGSYYDTEFVAHGFLRNAKGAFTTFDPPGAALIGTVPTDINPMGTIAGYYYDINFIGHGFLRAANGTLTAFDAPGAGITGDNPGTYAVGINPQGTIVGMYTDANNSTHGFLRAHNGTFTTFDPPGSIQAVSISFSYGKNLYITPDGVITGTYKVPISDPFPYFIYHVFVRTRGGTFITFDAATYEPCCIWSFPTGITPAGVITGSFNDGPATNHGFLRARNGRVTTFDVPGAGTKPHQFPSQGTVPLGINPAGVIMGFYVDENGAHHGFLLLGNRLCRGEN
jgi:predicted membrane protein